MRRASRFPAMAALGFFASAVLRAPAVAESDTVWTPTIPPGWEKVSLPDLLSTGDFGFRASQVSGYLETIGDFDGDGHRDIAQVFVNRRTDQHAVFVTLNARAVVRIYKVIEEPANLMARIAISRVLPGEYRNTCAGQKANLPACTPASFKIKNDGLAYFTFDSVQKLVYWDGRGFAAELVGD